MTVIIEVFFSLSLTYRPFDPDFHGRQLYLLARSLENTLLVTYIRMPIDPCPCQNHDLVFHLRLYSLVLLHLLTEIERYW